MSMFRSSVLMLAVLGAAVSSQAAVFDYAFSATDNSFSGTLHLTATDNGDGTFSVTSGTGTVTKEPEGITDLTLLGGTYPNSSVYSPSGQYTYDNTLYPAKDPLLSLNGLLFSTNLKGTTEVNIWGNNPGQPYTFSDNVNGTAYIPGYSITFSQVPEPTVGGLLGAGALSLLGLRKRNKKA